MDPIKQICRFCLAEEDLLTNCTLHDEAVQAKITNIFSFPFNSGASFPSRICNGCYLKINEYYEFTEKVRQNQEQLIANEALTFQVNIKLESTETVVLENPIVVKEPVLIDDQTTIIKTEVVSDEGVFDEVVPEEVISDEVVHEGDEEQVVSSDSNHCMVQGQDEVLQFKIEFEDTELQSERDPIMDRVKKAAEGDRLIKEFFGLICETCSTQCDTFTRLKQHTKVMHNKTLSFTCCNKQYFQRCLLVDHIASHSNPRPFQCDSCEKSFRWQTTLTQHRLMHSVKEGWPFKCDQCPKSYPKRHMLRAHMARHVPMECDICHKVLSDVVSLNTHKKKVHNNARIICDICGDTLSSKQGLHYHKTRVHKTANPVECPLCQRSFLTKRCMIDHVKTMHKMTCNVCNRSYPHLKALTAHMGRVHVEAVHECDICGKKFKEKIQLRTHYATHKSEKLYSCNLCGLRMKARSNLCTHMRKQHPKEWAERKQKKC